MSVVVWALTMVVAKAVLTVDLMDFPKVAMLVVLLVASLVASLVALLVVSSAVWKVALKDRV